LRGYAAIQYPRRRWIRCSQIQGGGYAARSTASWIRVTRVHDVRLSIILIAIPDNSRVVGESKTQQPCTCWLLVNRELVLRIPKDGKEVDKPLLLSSFGVGRQAEHGKFGRYHSGGRIAPRPTKKRGQETGAHDSTGAPGSMLSSLVASPPRVRCNGDLRGGAVAAPPGPA